MPALILAATSNAGERPVMAAASREVTVASDQLWNRSELLGNAPGHNERAVVVSDVGDLGDLVPEGLLDPVKQHPRAFEDLVVDPQRDEDVPGAPFRLLGLVVTGNAALG